MLFTLVIAGLGSNEQAHKADEDAARDQLALCEPFLTHLGAELASGIRNAIE